MKKIFLLSFALIGFLSLSHLVAAEPIPPTILTVDLHDYSYPPEASTDANSGGQVSMLQNFLNTANYMHGNVSGYFGSITKNAVVDFQTRNGLFPANGYVGPITRAKIATGIYVVNPGNLNGPRISSLSSFSGAIGSHLTIYGSGFTSTGNNVHIGDNVVNNLSSTGNSISFSVSSSVTLGFHGLYVENSNGGPSNIMNFIVLSNSQIGAPNLSSLSPNPAPVSSEVDVNGSGQIMSTIFYPVLTDNGCSPAIVPIHFSPTTGRPIVTVPYSYPCTNSNHLVVPGNYIVQALDSGNWQISNSVNFVVNVGGTSSPITVLSPNGGEGWQSTPTITDTISGFEQYKKDVTWTGSPDYTDPTIVEAYLEKQVSGQYITVGRIIPLGYGSIMWVVGEVSNTNCALIFPSNLPNSCYNTANMQIVPPGQYWVRLVDKLANTTDRSDSSFTITAGTQTSGPHISFLSSFSGSAGSQLIIRGTGFTSTGNTVNFDVGGPSGISSFNGISLTVNVPNPLPMGVRAVSVSNANGISNPITFVVTSGYSKGAPNISYITPTGSTGSEVKIIGSGFSSSGDNSVLFYPVLVDAGCSPYVARLLTLENGMIKFVVPGYYKCFDSAGGNTYHSVVPGNYIVQALNGNYQISNAVNFVVTAGPIVPPSLPFIQIISPNGGEVFYQTNVGQTTVNTIGWTRGLISTVHIFLTTADATPKNIPSLGVIWAGATTNSDSVMWDGKTVCQNWTGSSGTNCSTINPGSYKVYIVGDVEGVTNQAVNDLSDASFTITSKTPATPTTLKSNPSIKSTPSTSTNKMQSANAVYALQSLINQANGNNLTAEVKNAINLLLKNLKIFGGL